MKISHGMDEEYIQKAAELLLKGAKMLNLNCPICLNPILKLKNNEMYCVKCNKNVIFEHEVKSEIAPVLVNDAFQDQITKKINKLLQQLEIEEDPTEIIKLSEAIKKLKELS